MNFDLSSVTKMNVVHIAVKSPKSFAYANHLIPGGKELSHRRLSIVSQSHASIMVRHPFHLPGFYVQVQALGVCKQFPVLDRRKWSIQAVSRYEIIKVQSVFATSYHLPSSKFFHQHISPGSVYCRIVFSSSSGVITRNIFGCPLILSLMDWRIFSLRRAV